MPYNFPFDTRAKFSFPKIGVFYRKFS